MGLNEDPFVVIITGSSYKQNQDFMRRYKINNTLSANSHIRNDPYLILAENGAIQINILDGSIKPFEQVCNVDLLSSLKDEFKQKLIAEVATKVLPVFNLHWSNDSSDQAEKVFIPPKKTMVTLDIPKMFKNGKEFRYSKKAESLRKALLHSMIHVAETLNLPFEVIGSLE